MVKGLVMFYPGQKVLCIDTRPMKPFSVAPLFLKTGEVYTVINEGTSDYLVGDQMITFDVIFIEELFNGMDGVDYGFSRSRFRPLNDSRLDIFRKAFDLVEAWQNQEQKSSCCLMNRSSWKMRNRKWNRISWNLIIRRHIHVLWSTQTEGLLSCLTIINVVW